MITAVQHLVCGKWRNALHALCLVLCLQAFGITCHAQFNAAFDSSYRAAMALTDGNAKLVSLRKLAAPAYESSVWQIISYGNDFLTTATAAKSDSDQYQAHLVLCTGYERSRDYEGSVKNGLEAVAIAKKGKEYIKLIHAFQNVAFTYSSMGLMSGHDADFQKALYYCDQAMQTAKEQGATAEVPFTLTSEADVYSMAKKYDTAIGLYRRAIAVQKGQGMDGMESMYTNLAIALNIHGDYDAALAAYNTADSICTILNKGAYFKLKIASNRAELFSDMGNTEESERLTLQVLAAAQQTGATDIQVDLVDHLKSLYQKTGRYKEALLYADSLATIKEHILSDEKTSQVAEMQARYDAGVKDEQIAGQATVIQHKKRQNLLLWAGIALLFVAGSIAYFSMRRSKSLNRQIIAQQEQLLLQKTELQRINEMKDQLFSLIGHDLRTPLNSLIAYATILEEQGDLPPEKLKKYSADLRQTLGYTAVLLENLLQFAKTQMQATNPYPEMLLLSDVARQAAGPLQPALNQKKITLRTAFAADTHAFADEDMTALILRNLLSNAIKYSHTGGNITITIQPQDEGHIRCTVQDNGAGMQPELAALWNGDAVPAPVRSTHGTQQEKGAGLGLMLSKTFAVMMGGSMSVVSEEGKGAAFSLLLPRSKPGETT